MEDILTYIIVFGLIIGVVAVWKIRNSKPRPYLLSNQIFPQLILKLLIEKSEGKTKEFIIKVEQKENFEIKIPRVELIGKGREIELIDLDNLSCNRTKNKHSISSFELIFKYPFSKFSKLLKESNISFKTFRIIIEDNAGKKFKSHELAFNKTWTIYRPDSGKYN